MRNNENNKEKLAKSLIIFFKSFDKDYDNDLMEIYMIDLSVFNIKFVINRLNEVRLSYVYNKLPTIGYILSPFTNYKEKLKLSKKEERIIDFKFRLRESIREYNLQKKFDKDVWDISRKLGGLYHLQSMSVKDREWYIKEAVEIFKNNLEIEEIKNSELFLIEGETNEK